MAQLPEPQSPTLAAIYAAYESRRDEAERTYLGMSTMGTECDRALWYGFRWAAPAEHLDGRKLRLFETGHREEARMIEDLRMAGIMVVERDPATGGQWALSALGGHFRGHMDGRASGFPEAPVVEHVTEFKTHNEKSFKSLLKDGVEKSKPGHYAQMQLYMHFGGVSRAFYLAHCKNDDALYAERIHYDSVLAAQLVARAERIIGAARPPTRLHEDPASKAAFACGWCQARGICHEGEFGRTNCRTCLHSTPVNGGWHCARFARMLTVEDQRAGCPAHLFIPDLVPGEQIDANAGTETVTYRLRTGEVWIDGGARP